MITITVSRPHGARWIVWTAAAILLASCAAPQATQPVSLKRGTHWREVVKTGGAPVVRFSYLKDGRKYDLTTLEHSPNPVVFENARLFAVLPPNAMTDLDRNISEHLKTVELPFEHGPGNIHSWILAKRAERPASVRHDPVTPGSVAEYAAAGVILAPIAPILLAGGVCYATEYAMTGSERSRAQQINEALLASGPSYQPFLDWFRCHDFHTEKGIYQIREYLATDGAFFTGRDFFYEVGLRNGKPLWVTYENDSVRSHAVRYWSAHR
jgi:hypothetical protein